MSNAYHSEDAKQIQARLREEAAKIYTHRSGKNFNRPGGFDPLVHMLLGAAASEFEKISLDLHSSWTRMLEQMAQLLTPEVYTGPQPSHGIAHAEPIEDWTHTSVKDQVVVSGHQDIDIFLSPSGRFKLAKGGVRMMCVGDTLYQIDKQGLKQPLCRSTSPSNAYEVWLGLDLPDHTQGLQGLHFFGKWDHERLSISPGEFLLTSKWYHQGNELSKQLGLQEEPSSVGRVTYPIADEFKAVRVAEKSVHQFYHDRFVRLALAHQTDELGVQAYPVEFADRFSQKDLDSLSE
ncbi:MAG: hypothetical protein AAF804_22165, partial [Bacteroidota bacterium]